MNGADSDDTQRALGWIVWTCGCVHCVLFSSVVTGKLSLLADPAVTDQRYGHRSSDLCGAVAGHCERGAPMRDQEHRQRSPHVGGSAESKSAPAGELMLTGRYIDPEHE